MLGFVLNPILAGFSDSKGRKPLMMLSPIVSLIKNIVTAVASPTVPVLIAGDMLRPLTMSSWMIARQAALGDLLKHKPEEYSAASSKVEMLGQIVSAARSFELNLRLLESTHERSGRT